MPMLQAWVTTAFCYSPKDITLMYYPGPPQDELLNKQVQITLIPKFNL